MVAQFAERLPCIKVSDEGVFFDDREADKELEAFYDRIISQDVDYFRISREHAAGLYAFHEQLSDSNLKNIACIKCQITGPFTFAGSINDAQGNPLVFNEIFMQVIVKALIMKALWQIKLFRPFGKPILVFLDEPYLGSFGSAYTPLDRQDVISVLTECTQPLKAPDVLVGVHCCGNTDWSIFTDVPHIDVINFDAYSFLDKILLYADPLKTFFQRSGLLCWGVVPTQEFSDAVTLGVLKSKVEQGMEALARKGLDRALIAENLMLSPSCGLGTLKETQAQKIFKLLSELSLQFRGK
jgi:methionine synthase II (cobalamin-independent)